MAITKSAKKAIRSSARKRLSNDRRRRDMRSEIKEISDLVEKGNRTEAEEKLPVAYKAIDKAAKRGVIKANTAARKKSHIAKQIKDIK